MLRDKETKYVFDLTIEGRVSNGPASFSCADVLDLNFVP